MRDRGSPIGRADLGQTLKQTLASELAVTATCGHQRGRQLPCKWPVSNSSRHRARNCSTRSLFKHCSQPCDGGRRRKRVGCLQCKHPHS